MEEKGSILIIQKENIEFLQLMLILNREYDFYSSSNYSNCISLIESHKPEILILNVLNSKEEEKVDEILKYIKSLNYNINILITGEDKDKRLEEKYVKMGVDDFISSPYKISIIKAKIEKQFEIRDYIKKIEKLSNFDALTSLPNRRFFDSHLNGISCFFKNRNIQISILICDIDFFKKINDNYGHKVGDLALIHVANVLKESLRQEDFISRWGGEEFVVILQDCDKEKTFSIAEKLRLNIENNLFKINKEENIKITMSVGVSFIKNISKEKIEEALNEADKALYKAKEEGRNRVCFI